MDQFHVVVDLEQHHYQTKVKMGPKSFKSMRFLRWERFRFAALRFFNKDFVIAINQSLLICMLHKSILRVAGDAILSRFAKARNFTPFLQTMLIVKQRVLIAHFARHNKIENTIVLSLGEVSNLFLVMVNNQSIPFKATLDKILWKVSSGL